MSGRSSPVVLFGISLGVFMVQACAPGPPRPVEIMVRVTESNGRKQYRSPLVSVCRHNFIENDLAREAGKRGDRAFMVSIFPGELLAREDFVYVYRGDEKEPLYFNHNGPLLRLNGTPVCVDLGHESIDDVARFFETLPIAERTSIRNVVLSGKPGRDRQGLSLFKDSGIVISGSTNYETGAADVAKAVAATDPTGLIITHDTAFTEIPDGLGGLRYLAWHGSAVADAGRFPDLRFYFHRFKGDTPELKGIDGHKRLRTLILGECGKIDDFSPVAQLRGLEYLTITGGDHFDDLSLLQSMSALRSLSLIDTGVHDCSGIEALKNLEYLTIVPSKQIEDVAPLKEMKSLKFLVVGDDDLKKRPEKYDELRAALPDTRIVGFCLGSGWILCITAFGVLAGLAARRRRGKQGVHG